MIPKEKALNMDNFLVFLVPLSKEAMKNASSQDSPTKLFTVLIDANAYISS